MLDLLLGLLLLEHNHCELSPLQVVLERPVGERCRAVVTHSVLDPVDHDEAILHESADARLFARIASPYG